MPTQLDNICDSYVNATCVDPDTGKPMPKFKIAGGKLDPEPVLAYPELGRVSTDISQIITTGIVKTEPLLLSGNYVIDKIIFTNEIEGLELVTSVKVRMNDVEDDVVLYESIISKIESTSIDFNKGLYISGDVYVVSNSNEGIRMTVIGRYPDSHFTE